MAWLCALLAAFIVAAIVLVVGLGWAGRQPWTIRLGLTAFAAGLIWGGVDRALQRPVGLGDLLMLAGIAWLLAILFGRALVAHLEHLDGRADGRLGPFGGRTPLKDPPSCRPG